MTNKIKVGMLVEITSNNTCFNSGDLVKIISIDESDSVFPLEVKGPNDIIEFVAYCDIKITTEKLLKDKIAKAILETLVISNKQSIHIAVDKILDIVKPKP